jgi:hypothetical protein
VKIGGAWSWPLTPIHCWCLECVSFLLPRPHCSHDVCISLASLEKCNDPSYISFCDDLFTWRPSGKTVSLWHCSERAMFLFISVSVMICWRGDPQVMTVSHWRCSESTIFLFISVSMMICWRGDPQVCGVLLWAAVWEHSNQFCAIIPDTRHCAWGPGLRARGGTRGGSCWCCRRLSGLSQGTSVVKRLRLESCGAGISAQLGW